MDAAWFAAIAQSGAMGILAYHFLVGLPAILSRIADEQRNERTFWATQAQADREEFSRRAELMAAELRQLTTTMGKLLDMVTKNKP